MGSNLPGFITKFTDVAKCISDLLKDHNDDFKEYLDKAGTIGALINIGIEIYSQIKEESQTEAEKAFNSLFRISFESAQKAISDLGAKKIPINNIDKAIKTQLFETFTERKDLSSYLPDHPSIIQFRNYIVNILKVENHTELIRDFVLKFNVTLDDMVDRNEDTDIKNFRRWSSTENKTKNLTRHLEYSRSIFNVQN